MLVATCCQVGMASDQGYIHLCIHFQGMGLHSNMFFLFSGVYQYSIKVELNGSTFGILDLPTEV